jgi:hypothetical protein
MRRISKFEQFVNENMAKLNEFMPLNEKNDYKPIELGSIKYKDLYDFIHNKMWRVAKDIIYGKEFQGDPINNDIVIKYSDGEIKAAELFYVLWTNIDQYTNGRDISREDLEGRMYHLSDGMSTDYRNEEWYLQMWREKRINAGYSSSGNLSKIVDKYVDIINSYIYWEMILSPSLKKYNLENPVNIRKMARKGMLRNLLKFEEYTPEVSKMFEIINGKEECIEGYKRQVSEEIIKNPAFGMEDYVDALSNARGFLQMKLSRPNITANTIGWNILHYICDYMYEFLLHYFSEEFSKSITGYRAK